jgi:transcriptional regulator with XRE-family HTH domain
LLNRLSVASTKYRHAVSTHVARLLREAREQKGISKTFLASKAGISQSMVTYIEAEERNPSLDILLRLTEALGLQLSGLLSDAEKSAKTGPVVKNSRGETKEILRGSE